jgi:Protein of unknown function (DUF2752)
MLLGAALAGAAGAWLLYRFDPTKATFYPRCVFHALTGLDCPGCGSTRALYQLLHGHVAAAFRYNAAMMLYLPVILFGGADMARAFATGQPPRSITTSPSLAWAITASIVGWWIVRNSPLWPYRM